VSLPWRDEILIELAPRRVTLKRTRHRLRSRAVANANRRVDNPSLVDWQPALAVLAKRLADPAWQGADARVVLSDHWARYAVVPWSDDISSDEERVAHGRICLANVYGKVVEQWRVSLSEAAPGLARVACAVPEALLGALRATLQANRLRMVSVQPQLIAAHNSWREQLPAAGGWFVTIDEGTLAAARLVRGGWDRVYTARIGTDWEVELQRLKAFGRLAAQDGEGDRVHVDAPRWLRERAGHCGTGIEWLLDPAAAANGNEHAVALERPPA
jgi:hypothetical protein